MRTGSTIGGVFLAAGVVRARRLFALGWIQAALEEGAKNRWLDARPVQLGDAMQDLQAVMIERQRIAAIKEAAVEVADRLWAE